MKIDVLPFPLGCGFADLQNPGEPPRKQASTRYGRSTMPLLHRT